MDRAFDPSPAASMDRSGYVREEAVRRLSENTDGDEVPYLLVRLNDWVSQVREAALDALRTRLRPDYAVHFVRNLPLVIRLADCHRYDHAPFIATVFELLRHPDSRPSLMDGLSSAAPVVRRLCFRLAIEAVDVQRSELLGRSIRDDDPIVRLWAVRAASSSLGLGDYLDLSRVTSRDRFMPVRRQTLVGLVQKSPERAEPALRASLLDPHRSIREVARYYLAKPDGFDARRHYREAIRAVPSDDLAPALAGLGETGAREDAEVVTPWLTHPRTKVRRAAVRALGRLDGDAHVDELLRAVEDDRSSVGRAAREALRGRLGLVDQNQLRATFQRGRLSHVRRHSLDLLAELGKWECLPYLVRACSNGDQDVRARARSRIEDWFARFNRSFAAPSPENLRRIETALAASGSSLAPETAKRLRDYLKGW